jgi:hypothetical protein
MLNWLNAVGKMKFNLTISFTWFNFALLKEVRRGDFCKLASIRPINITRIELRPASQICLLDAGFFMEYISTQYQHKVYLPLHLIREAVDNDWLDSLCYYVWLKNKHSKPIIYNPSLRKIGALLKCSPTTIKTHISVLKQHNLCHYEPGVLILKSTREFKAENRSQLVPVGISPNKSEQRDLLRFTLIKRNLHTQFKSFITKNNVLQFLRGKRFPYKVEKSLYRKNQKLNLNAESSLNNEMTLGNKKIGSICNRSQSTGIRIQKSFNNLELITSYKRVHEVAKYHNRRSFFEQFPGQSYFLSEVGTVFKRLSNGILLRQDGMEKLYYSKN